MLSNLAKLTFSEMSSKTRKFFKFGKVIGWAAAESHRLLVMALEGNAFSKCTVENLAKKNNQGRRGFKDTSGGVQKTNGDRV